MGHDGADVIRGGRAERIRYLAGYVRQLQGKRAHILRVEHFFSR